MKYKISYTDANKSKKATFGFKPYETDDIEAFVRVLNNFATCPVLLSEGHRANKNVKEVYGWLRFDTDEEGEARRVETAFTDAFYIKKPSTRNKQYPYKWHFFIKVDNQAQNTQQFKNQCLQICEARGIVLKDMAVTKTVVQNMNAYEGTIEDAVAATTVHEGSTIHLPAPTQEQEPVHQTVEPEGFSNLDDETDTGTTVAYDRTVQDIEKMLRGIDAGCDRDTWMGLVTSAYKLNPTSRDTVLAWSETGSNFTQQGFDNLWNEIEAGSYGAHHKGGFLIQTYNKAKGEESKSKYERYLYAIQDCNTVDEIKDLFRKGDWRQDPICTTAEQKPLPMFCKNRANEIIRKADKGEPKLTVGDFRPLVLINTAREKAAGEDIFLQYSNTGRPLPTLANLNYFVDHHSEMSCSYDVILKRPIVNNNYKVKTLELTHFYSLLSDELEIKGAQASVMLSRHYNAMLASRTSNGLLEYIEGLEPWDGETNYIKKVSETLNTDKAPASYVESCMRCFVIQAIAAWDNMEHTPHKLSKLENVLTFVGGQGIGKTTWMGGLMPGEMRSYFKEGLELDPSNKDSVIQGVSAGLVELGELDATTRKADISSLKSFLSTMTDEFRVPYARDPERYPRQTVFTGTVNNPDFLKDATGSRRFLALDVKKLKLPEQDTVKGMWAQAYALYKRGDNWLLNREELKAQIQINKMFTDIGEIGDIAKHFVEAIKRAKGKKENMSVTKILKGITDGGKVDKRDRSDFIAILATEGKTRNTQGKYYLPCDCIEEYFADSFDLIDMPEDKEFDVDEDFLN